MKQINVKQAERWLEKLKNENQQSYKDITKFLRKYEKTQDEFDCYIKISHILLSHTDLTKELNNYLEDGNKFIVNKPEDEKIKELMAYVKKYRVDIFNEIIEMIRKMSQNKGDNSLELNNNLKACLREIIKGDQELETITEKALDLTGEELIKRLELDHLKVKKNYEHHDAGSDLEQPRSQPIPKRPNKKQIQPKTAKDQLLQKPKQYLPRPKVFNSLTSISEQRAVFKQLQKILDEPSWDAIVKIIKIYFLNIITKNEAVDIINQIALQVTVQDDFEYLKDIVDARETERRKASFFRPLNDQNFSTYERASPSYVTLPFSYPIKSSGRSDSIRKLMNQKWISVPQGSQENQNFSVRNKNSNEINLLKAEDERYQFDLYMGRLLKIFGFITQVLEEKDERVRSQLVGKAVDLGVIQIMYKNCHKDQKQELEWFLKINEVQTCKVFKERIGLQISELKNIKEIYANKNWNEVAAKNFSKALDLKGFQFKKNEKQKMKGTSFISELNDRIKLVENGGESKATLIPFQDKKQFFTILNSFESSSRTQKCTSRKLPAVQSFDLKDERKRQFYPVMIIAFEDATTCQKIYTLIVFYIDSMPLSEVEKNRCKEFLEQLLIYYFGWSSPTKKVLSEFFDEEKLYLKIAKSSETQTEIDVSNWLITEPKPQNEGQLYEKQSEDEQPNQKHKLRSIPDQASRYSYMPTNSQDRKVLYGSEHLYTLIRFIYALYERFIKMEEVAQSQQKIEVFELLFYACIKAKQGVKFEENLNLLFNKHAYLFSTLYKLFDNLLKSASSVSMCILTNYSFKLNVEEESEDIYFVKLNKFCLMNGISNQKIIRITYEPLTAVLYINYLDSYYRTDDVSKENLKKRLEINRGIEYYTTENYSTALAANQRKRKKNEIIEKNDMEYLFEGNTIKMLNHQETEDIMLYVGKKQPLSKLLKRELKRIHKLIDKIA